MQNIKNYHFYKPDMVLKILGLSLYKFKYSYMKNERNMKGILFHSMKKIMSMYSNSIFEISNNSNLHEGRPLWWIPSALLCEAEYTLYRPDLALTLARCSEQLALVSVEPFLQNCGLLFDRSILARGVAPTGRLASRPCLRTLLQLSGKTLSSPIFRCGLGLDGPLQLACVLDQLLVALEGVLGGGGG